MIIVIYVYTVRIKDRLNNNNIHVSPMTHYMYIYSHTSYTVIKKHHTYERYQTVFILLN